jgi:LysM repeat protein
MSAVTLTAGPTRPARKAVPNGAVRTRRRQPTGPVRLTRRGRVVVTLLLLGLVLVALTIFSGQSAATHETGTVEPTRTVVVDDGDTLWDIAAEVAGSRDIREVVHEIETLNSLSGPELTEGQELAVPAP